MKTETKLTINDKTLTITKIPLGKYPELLNGIKELPKVINTLDGLDNNSIIAALPSIITSCFPDVVYIFSVATNLEKAEIEQLGLFEAIQIATAVLEVNNYKEIYSLIKKALAKPENQAKPVETKAN